MIISIKVNDNTKSSVEYLPNIKAFANGREYIFKPGVNIIVGPNGSGKSTLIKLLADMTFCHSSMFSQVPDDALAWPPIFDRFGEEVLDGVDIHSDYLTKVFRLASPAGMKTSDVLGSINNLAVYMDSIRSSDGERVVLAIKALFQQMFGTNDLSFVIQDLKDRVETSNDHWQKKIENLINYYRRNYVKIDKSNTEYTTLMDEPDRNLDIDNIKEVYSVLSFHKEQSQIIAVIHNPALIYKLAQLKDINFIEMEDGYLDKVLTFMREK